MITKIILTLLVIAAGYFYLKRQSVSKSASVRQPTEISVSSASSVPVKLIAGLLVGIFSVATVSFVGYRWYDNSRLLEVRLISPATPEPLVYQVRKGDLKERSFTTTDGQIVRISASERLEVMTLEP